MINILALSAGLLTGFVLGSIMILNKQEKVKYASVVAFASIITVAMGGGLYLFSIEQRDTLFQFILALSFGVIAALSLVGLYQRKRGKKKYYERGSKEIIEEEIMRYKKGRLVSRTRRRIVRKR